MPVNQIRSLPLQLRPKSVLLSNDEAADFIQP
jgi:hypothetical protein